MTIIEKQYRYWLCNVEGLGAVRIANLLSYFGSAQEVFLCTEKNLKESRILHKKEINNLLLSKKDFEKLLLEYHKLPEQNIRFITPNDMEYPERLKHIYNPPQGLYIKGNPIQLEDMPSVAIVGARSCSYYGKETAKRAAIELAKQGITIISGLASGIDSEAHLGTLEACGKTLAVLGNGVDICYPSENEKIYQNILKKGSLISEFPLQSPPLSCHFPQRNRIISGLADVILVIEARLKSGSLITADLALEQGKEVFAVPGRIYDALSEGCNNLIKQGANVYTNIDDIAQSLNLKCGNKEKNDIKINLGLAHDEEKVYSEVDLQPKSLNEIVEKCGLSTAETAKILFQLELSGLIQQTEKNFYVIKI